MFGNLPRTHPLAFTLYQAPSYATCHQGQSKLCASDLNDELALDPVVNLPQNTALFGSKTTNSDPKGPILLL